MATIGHILKNERNKKKISLDEVYIKTKISQRVIALLEEDKFNELPNPSYAKYFIRTYAKFLGLNPEEIASKIYPSKKSDYQTKKIDQTKTNKKDAEAVMQLDPNFKKAFLKVILLLIVLVVLSVSLILVKKAVSKIASNLKQKRQSAETTVKISPSPKAAAKDSSRKNSSLKEQLLAIPKNEDISMILKTTDEVWLKVTVDGKVLFQNSLPRNSNEVWKAKEKIELKVGKPEAIELIINSEPILIPKLGQNIVITKDSLKIVNK